MKRFCACVLLIVCCMNCMKGIPVIAEDEFQSQNVNQDKIDALFDELNSLALQEYMSNSSGSGVRSQAYVTNHADRKALIDAQLEELGIHKIDPENPDDMAYLAELPVSNEPTALASGIYDSAPDLSTFAKVYSIYVSDGSVNPFYNGANDPGESYSYRWIRVVDNKGYNGLYNQETFNLLIDNDFKNTTTAKLLGYNFRFAFSQFLGKYPYGITLDWGLGAFEIFLSDNINFGSKNIYELYLDTVSDMTYYYMYYRQGWQLIGVYTEAKLSRVEHFRGNVNGEPCDKKLREEKSKLYAKDLTIKEYVANYISHKSISYNLLGTLSTEVKDDKGNIIRTCYYTPKFAKVPIDLIRPSTQ